jgi:hypothetical protein
MRRDVQEIFFKTPHQKQVMMFSATLSTDTRAICKKFMDNVCAVLACLGGLGVLTRLDVLLAWEWFPHVWCLPVANGGVH